MVINLKVEMTCPSIANFKLRAGFLYRKSEGSMAKSQTIGKYAHLEYRVLHELELSISEYWYLDMVYQLSRDGWCYKSLSSIAIDMRITKNGVIKMRDRLIGRGLIKKNLKGYVKTTDMYNSVYRLDEKTYNSVTSRTTEYTDIVQLSGTKNNNRITKNKETNFLKRYKTPKELGMFDLSRRT